MRLYLDQMFRVELANILRTAGHNVLRAADTGLSRADDSEILQYAINENRVLLTLDEHFGDWTVLPLRQHTGVLRIRIHPPLTDVIAARLMPFLENYKQSDFINHLIIIAPLRERWISTL
jgi:predicted nuclease of predicted toxin-antitoxin system